MTEQDSSPTDDQIDLIETRDRSAFEGTRKALFGQVEPGFGFTGEPGEPLGEAAPAEAPGISADAATDASSSVSSQPEEGSD
jgi:hypothetical protein